MICGYEKIPRYDRWKKTARILEKTAKNVFRVLAFQMGFIHGDLFIERPRSEIQPKICTSYVWSEWYLKFLKDNNKDSGSNR